MPQLTRGARQALDQIRADLADIREARELAQQEVFDPHYVRDRLREIAAIEARIERRLRDELEPLLERQAPQYEARLADLEQRIRAIEQERSLVLELGQRRQA